jgi:MFS family permease
MKDGCEKTFPRIQSFFRMAKTSTWMALRNPVFRKLWLATLISGTCVAAHDTAATWTMHMMTNSALLISLISTVASLPFFLFTLPAGALADILDRKRIMYFMNTWLAVSAGGLALCGWLHLLNPIVLLIGVFLIGIGFAFNAPAWTSIQPEIVTHDELPSAATLGGLQLNISSIIGPALGGMVLPMVGANTVFAGNALCFLLIIVTVAQLRRKELTTNLPLENFVESFLTAIRYVRYAPGIQVVLARNILFALFISVIPALLPVVGLKELHLNASSLGLVFTCMGIGSVLGAVFIMPLARAKFASNSITVLANILVAVVFGLMALIRHHEFFLVAAMLAGIAWTMAASELWVAGQRTMPSWARGRMNATVIMVSQGAMALGGVIWGSSALMWGVQATLLMAAALLLVSLILLVWLSIDFTETLNVEPASVSRQAHRLIHQPQPRDGPVIISIDVKIDRRLGPTLMNLLREVRLIHLRNGAFAWRLYEDLGQINTYRLEMMYPSWAGYLLQRERMTRREQETIDQAIALHIGEHPPERRHFLCVNQELHTRRFVVTRPTGMVEAPLGVEDTEVS